MTRNGGLTVVRDRYGRITVTSSPTGFVDKWAGLNEFPLNKEAFLSSSSSSFYLFIFLFYFFK